MEIEKEDLVNNMKKEKKLKILAAGDIHGDTGLVKKLVEKADSMGKNTLKTRKALVVRTALAGLNLTPEKRRVALKLGRSLVERIHMVTAWGKDPKKDPVIRELEVDIYDSIGIRTGALFTSGLKDAYKNLVGER